jgi:hypothetical protein
VHIVMSQALETSIQAAIDSQGQNKEANKAYLEFIKANFIIPIHANTGSPEPEVLFLEEQNAIYLPVFSEMTYFDTWAKDIKNEIELLKLSGVDLLKGVGDEVTICLNPTSPYYKTFIPDEIKRMRSIVLKFFSSN